MRCILIILDGLGDRGQTALEGQTPLQAARTPHLDRLAALGATGLYHPWRLGSALPSELAHFLLFGYDWEDFPGRGYIEALGEGLVLAATDVALLGRLFVVQRQRRRLVLREENPAVAESDCRVFQQAIASYEHAGVTVTFVPTGGIKGIVVLRGEVSPKVTDANPIYEGRPLMEVLPWEGYEEDPKARHTALVLNNYIKWCHQKLTAHPANRARKRAGLAPLNAVGLQRAGQYKTVVPFYDKWGLKPLAIAAGPLYRGLSRHLGMDMAPAKDTADPQRDLLLRLQRAHQARRHDFIYIHTKVPDEAAHTKDPLIKKAAIEALDGALAFALKEMVPDPDTLLVITADHATNSSGVMIHSGEAVPLLMVGKYAWRDHVQRFDEISCAQGALGLLRGPELMLMILNWLDRGKLVGLRDSPRDYPYFPGPYTPLKLDRPARRQPS